MRKENGQNKPMVTGALNQYLLQVAAYIFFAACYFIFFLDQPIGRGVSIILLTITVGPIFSTIWLIVRLINERSAIAKSDKRNVK
jgi:hypothetical protein